MSPLSNPTSRSRLATALCTACFGAAATALAACANPPEQAIDTARLAFKYAQSMGAAEYAGESLLAAEAADQALSSELETQSRKPGLLRSYAKAATLADAVRAAAEQATLEAEIGKERAHRRTQEIIRSTRTSLESLWASHMALANAANVDSEQAELESDLTFSGQLLDEARAMLAAGRYLEAEIVATNSQLTADAAERRLIDIRARIGVP